MALGRLCMLTPLMDTTPTSTAVSVESAHTTSHKSASMHRADLIPPGERRRRWTTEQKQTIAAESFAPGASPSAVARLHGIGTGQLYTWRQALKAAQPAASPSLAARFARVDVASPDAAARRSGLIEIVLADGTTLRVDPAIDPGALRRVLAVLRG